jgi:hypothetical protein
MQAARDEAVGLWQGTFVVPAMWRQAYSIFADRPTFRPTPPAN